MQDYFGADVVTATDYYPFGMKMPGRKYSDGDSYRYGFNGKENDKDISEGGQDYGMRIYDGRLGRFLSVDPVTSSYPFYPPYQFAGNNPIEFIDIDGKEPGLNKIIDELISDYKSTTTQITAAKWVMQNVLEPSMTALSDKIKTASGDVKSELQSKLQFYQIGYANLMVFIYKLQALEKNQLLALQTVDKMNHDMNSGIEAIEQVAQWLPFLKNKLNKLTSPVKEGLQENSQKIEDVQNNNGINNIKTRDAVNLGNKVHYDNLNGGVGEGLPTELQNRYPDTQFRFIRREQKGADVEYVGGTHPSDYPGSTWAPGAKYGDFKPDTKSGAYKLRYEIKSGKLPEHTQYLPYNSQTGKLK